MKLHYPKLELDAYGSMFILGGDTGLLGVFLLSRIPEPKSFLGNENVFKLFIMPLKDNSFFRLRSKKHQTVQNEVTKRFKIHVRIQGLPHKDVLIQFIILFNSSLITHTLLALLLSNPLSLEQFYIN